MTSYIPYIIVATGVLMAFRSLKQARQVDASQTWPATQGEVIESDIQREDGTGRPRVKYRYRVNDKELTAATIRPGGLIAKEEVVERYPVGGQVLVFYDPSNPAEACLEREGRSSAYFGVLIGVALVVGGVILAVR